MDSSGLLRKLFERETRLELATLTLARLCSTTELFPHKDMAFYYKHRVACQGLIAIVFQIDKFSSKLVTIHCLFYLLKRNI